MASAPVHAFGRIVTYTLILKDWLGLLFKGPIALTNLRQKHIQTTMDTIDIEIVLADLNCGHHQAAVVAMLDAYSADPMGDGRPLSDYARQHLISGLQQHPTTLIFLALDRGAACGIATCFRGFSTFAARPLINISDFYVVPAFRGKRIGRMLLDAIEKEARATGCCKLTLEVQQNNPRARSIYTEAGFAQAVYAADVDGGGSLYMVKSL